MNPQQLQYEINSAINVCNGRIENGANIQEAFKWLNEETAQIFNGETIYGDDKDFADFSKLVLPRTEHRAGSYEL